MGLYSWMKYTLLLLLLITSLSISAQTYKVMTFNIRYDNSGDGVNQWGKRSDKVAAVIQKYDPDFIGLQEALHNQIIDIVKALPQYAIIGVGRDDGKEKGEYSAILYKKDKFQIVTQKTSWLSENPDVPGSKSWDAAITRVVTSAHFRDIKTKREFLYYNTHFDHIGQEARRNSAQLIVDMIRKETSTKHLTAFLTGDFNAKPTDEPYLVIMKSPLLKDARPGESNQGTFCSFKVNSIECSLIDHIFYTAGWKSENYKVITDNDGEYYPSDHLPVITELTPVSIKAKK